MRWPNNWTDALKITLRSTFVAVALLLPLLWAGGGLSEERGRAVGISSQPGDAKAAWAQEGGAGILPDVTVPVEGGGRQGDVSGQDLSGGACSPPGEVSGLLFVDRQTLVWSPPADPGVPPAVLYDTLRATQAGDFVDNFSATCIESDGGDQTTTEAEDPPLGRAFFYQIGAKNPCGEGSLGMASDGNARRARSCSGGNGGQEAPNGAGWPSERPNIARQPTTKNSGTVYLHSGEHYLEQVDLRIPGRGFDFEWRRTYRSREGRLTNAGWGWDFSYNRRVELSGDNAADRWVYDGSSRRDTYRPAGNDCWAAEGFFRELCLQPDGSYVLTFTDKKAWRFAALDGSPAGGRIIEAQDRNQNRMAFAYDGLGRLVTITDTLDRPIQVSYNAEGFISAVTDFAGRQVRYGYYQDADPGGSFGDVRSWTSPAVNGTPNGNDYPAGKTTTYTYTEGMIPEALNHNLLTITDPQGQPFLQNVYTATSDPLDPRFDRVERQILPGGVIAYVYVRQSPTSANAFATTKTILNDRAGNVREAFFNNRNQLVILREYTGRAPDPGAPTNDSFNRPTGKLRPDDPDVFETRYDYNADSLRTRLVHPNLNLLQNVYESELNPAAPRRSQGNLRELHRLPGSLGADQPEIVLRLDYHPAFNFVTRQVDGRGNETSHAYDLRGNRLHTQHRIPTIVEDFEYNASGQMTAHISPDNGSGHRRRDEFTYHAAGPQRGYLQSQIIDAGGFTLTTGYEYDAVGNVTRVIDPRGRDMLYTVNALNQVVRETPREVTDGSGVRYQDDVFYDGNDNVIRLDVQNRDEQGVLQPNTDLTTTYEYDLLDRLIRATREVDGNHETVREYQYDANDHRRLIRFGQSTNGAQPTNVVGELYDERDLRFRAIRAQGDPRQSTTQYDYDANGNPVRVSRGLEGSRRVTTRDYDGYDRKVRTTDSMGNVRTWHYDANGNRVSRRVEGELTDIEESAGNTRLSEEIYTYDAMDRLMRTDMAFFDLTTQAPIGDGQATTLIEYTDTSRVMRVTDDNGHQTGANFDTANRRGTVTDAKGNTLTYSYDANSNVITTTTVDKSDLGNLDRTITTTFEYDNLDRRTKTRDNVGNVNQYSYDSRNNLTTTTDSRGNTVRYAYDGLSRLLSTRRALTDTGGGGGIPTDEIVTAQRWDDSSRLIEQVDDNGNATDYAYDALDRLIVARMADGTHHQVGSGASWPLDAASPDLSNFQSGYDVHENPIKTTDANGSVVTGAYDLLNRLTRRDIVPGLAVSNDTTFEIYQHDGLSRIVRAEDDDSLVSRLHDSLSHVTVEDQRVVPTAPTRIVMATHDGVGNLTRLGYPGGRAIVQTFDSLNRPALVNDEPAGGGGPIANNPASVQGAAQYRYVGAGRVERRELGNSTLLDVGYDGIRRVTSTRQSRTSDQAIDDRSYAWDPMHNKTAADDLQVPSQNRTSVHDSVNRLVRSQIGQMTPTQYTFDGVGNRTEVIGDTDPGMYTMESTLPEPADKQVNQYTQSPFANYKYDLNGNLTETSIPTAQRKLTFDYRNRLVQLSDPGSGQAAAYRYDCLGRRTESSRNGSVTRFYWHGWREIEEQSLGDSTVATYVWGYAPGELLQMNRGGQERFYHADDLGSIRKVTDPAGNVLEQYDYGDYGRPRFFDAFGNEMGSSAIGNPYLFTGQRFDFESGLYYHRTRYLGTRVGRYISRDSIGTWGDSTGVGNAYAYLGDNPVSGSGVLLSAPPQDDGPMPGWRDFFCCHICGSCHGLEPCPWEQPPPPDPPPPPPPPPFDPTVPTQPLPLLWPDKPSGLFEQFLRSVSSSAPSLDLLRELDREMAENDSLDDWKKGLPGSWPGAREEGPNADERQVESARERYRWGRDLLDPSNVPDLGTPPPDPEMNSPGIRALPRWERVLIEERERSIDRILGRLIYGGHGGHDPHRPGGEPQHWADRWYGERRDQIPIPPGFRPRGK